MSWLFTCFLIDFPASHHARLHTPIKRLIDQGDGYCGNGASDIEACKQQVPVVSHKTAYASGPSKV